MKLNPASTLIMVSGLLFSGTLFASDPATPPAESGGIMQWSSRASASVGHSIAASGQVTSAIATIPFAIGGLLVSGTAASISSQQDAAQVNAAPIGTPLEISDESITIMPPNQALKDQPKP